MTLIELLSVLVVISMLVAIAVPSYRSYRVRSHRTDATTALLRIQSGQERYLVQHGKYTGELTAKPADGGLGLTAQSEQGFYDLDVKLSGVGYIATATARSDKGQKDDKNCKTMTIDDTGRKGAKNASSIDRTAECWR